ncbi:hypothetical protein PCL_08425 [Purpureocillium lilacinum]|uniref:Uncharacterized protein n=1 Tax=Purpureocillium lilacinum TaxID=33203 RepID=A0A2U3DRV9_PURLI|nr:hypothetical protein PCL_08425 [Purpureocillium lilacinum]
MLVPTCGSAQNSSSGCTVDQATPRGIINAVGGPRTTRKDVSLARTDDAGDVNMELHGGGSLTEASNTQPRPPSTDHGAQMELTSIIQQLNTSSSAREYRGTCWMSVAGIEPNPTHIDPTVDALQPTRCESHGRQMSDRQWAASHKIEDQVDKLLGLERRAQAQSRADPGDVAGTLRLEQHRCHTSGIAMQPPSGALGEQAAAFSGRCQPLAPIRELPSQISSPPKDSWPATNDISVRLGPLRAYLGQLTEQFPQTPGTVTAKSARSTNDNRPAGSAPPGTISNVPLPTSIHSLPSIRARPAPHSAVNKHNGRPVGLPDSLVQILTRATGEDNPTLGSCKDSSGMYYCPLCQPSRRRWKGHTWFTRHLLGWHSH